MADRSLQCDVLIVGGGLSGSVLGAELANAGYSVVIAEREHEFRDRVRGEVLLPWGTLEAQKLGIYEFLLETCASTVPREIFMRGGEVHQPRDYTTSTPGGTSALSFYHPEMQEQLLRRAAKSGVEVLRGASLKSLELTTPAKAELVVGKSVIEFTARLIVGADGRESRLAVLLGLNREVDEPELYTGGLQFSGDLDTDNALYFSLSDPCGLGSILISNRPGNYRAYLLHHKDALERRLSGPRDYEAVKKQFADIGWSRDWLEALTPHGTFATFDGAHRWVPNPVCGNFVLVGDAACSSDPVWGNGLSRTLRDVRMLSEHLLNERDWGKATANYAAEHLDSYLRLRRLERLCAKLYFTPGEAGKEQWRRMEDVFAQHPQMRPDMAALGPEAHCDDESERLLIN